jgi:hypothetical protein
MWTGKKKMKDLMTDKKGVEPQKKTLNTHDKETLSKKKKRILTRLPEYLEICTG